MGQFTDFSEFVPKYDETFKQNEIIVAGIVKSQKDKDEDAEEAKDHVPTDVTHLKTVVGIPDFWEKAVRNNQMMMQTIREKDADTLKYLTNVEVT